jgi:signal transduction histidine kinase
MTLARLRRKIFGRRSVRARIAVACAGLFLVIAAAFTAAIYTVVDRSFGPAPPPNSIPAGLVRTCQTAEANHTLKLDPALGTQCQYFLGAANQRTHDLHQLLLWSLAGLGVATIVAGISGWAIGRRILLPLHTITTAARRASRERLDERISLDGPADELKELADTFDDMLNRLDLAFASQRRFVANASHELRTPLTSMRTLIDVAMAKPTRTTGQLEVLAGRVRQALDQSDALIDGLLTLARSDRGLTTRELVDLEAAAQDAIDHASTAARTSGIVIDAELSPAPTLGDRVLLERLAANLLDNAVHYNLTGGSVRVVTGSDDDVSYITVTNSGPLVPESAVTSLFEPFTRLEGRVSNSRGVGLGLSIVTSVVNAHHGHLDAEALPDGGMKISARLPKTTVGTSTDDIGQPVKDRIPPSMNTRSKSSLPTATTLSANPGAVEPAILPGGRALRTPRCRLGLVVQPLSCSVSGARCSCSGRAPQPWTDSWTELA